MGVTPYVKGETMFFISDELPSVKPPFRYFGAKTKARRDLVRFIPPNTTEVVSPFIGGGAFELYLTARGIRVHGFDINGEIVNLWQCLLSHPRELCAEVKRVISTLSVETWRDRVEEFTSPTGCPVKDAAHCLILQNFTFNNMGKRHSGCISFVVDPDGVPRRAQDWCRTRRVVLYERIEEFQNGLLTVRRADFRDALAANPTKFAYLDPPYPNSGDIYGDAPEHHEEFPHETLAEMLSGRSGWMLNYNDCDVIRDLYPDTRFNWNKMQWKQSGNKFRKYIGNEVLITPRE